MATEPVLDAVTQTDLNIVRRLTREIQELEETRDEIVKELHNGRASWTQIGEALGLSRQGAWRKYRDKGESDGD